MNRFIVETDNITHAKLFLQLMKELRFIKSVTSADKKLTDDKKNTETASYNWINPNRPATDKEIELMLAECDAEYEAGMGLTSKPAKKESEKRIQKWRKEKQK